MEKANMSIEEVAYYIDVSVPMIRKLVRAHLIPYMKIGNRLKFKKTSIDEWLKAKESQGRKNPIYSLI